MVRLPCGSRSTRSTFMPCSAKATPRFSAVVVLATPPFWLAKAMTLPSVAPFEMSSRVPGRGSRRASPIRPFLSSDSSRTLYQPKCRPFFILQRGFSTLGLSCHAAHVGAAFLVGVGTDALVHGLLTTGVVGTGTDTRARTLRAF